MISRHQVDFQFNGKTQNKMWVGRSGKNNNIILLIVIYLFNKTKLLDMS